MKQKLTITGLLLLATFILAACNTAPPQTFAVTEVVEVEVTREVEVIREIEVTRIVVEETHDETSDTVADEAAEILGAATHAVDLIGAWVNAGAPEAAPFDYEGIDGKTHQGTFEVDILPLFTTNGIWFDGSQACTGCHFANSENSYHEMNLSTYEGIITGADSLEDPPGVSILGQSIPGEGDFDWENSELRKRLRDNRMPPRMPFDITEENRDGPTLDINGTEVRAVTLIADWVNAGVPETEPFGDYGATFEANVLPLFTENSAWYDGSQACTGCHFAGSELSDHEMDLTTYEGVLAGADVLEAPPGVSILGESEPGAGDYDWEHSAMRVRLRDNRMPPGSPFDPTEANRDGPLVLHGQRIEIGLTDSDLFGNGECQVNAVNLIGAWVEAGAPETDAFEFTDLDGEACSGTFEADVLHLFTENNVWYDGSQACTGCHFAASEESYHEMDLSSYAGILAGADTLEDPPGVSILGESTPGAGDFDWSNSKLHARLRNNRMPPGMPFDITEENRDGPTLDINGSAVRAVTLIADWVTAGAPETEPFGDYGATFEEHVLPLFTENNAWYDGSQACAGCHFDNSEISYHEMNLSSYEGILTGADVISEPPGVSILGQDVPGEGDFDWDAAKLHARLRNNRMPPGIPFDITEENRDGPVILAGTH